jgi:hypothetical protein
MLFNVTITVYSDNRMKQIHFVGKIPFSLLLKLVVHVDNILR